MWPLDEVRVTKKIFLLNRSRYCCFSCVSALPSGVCCYIANQHTLLCLSIVCTLYLFFASLFTFFAASRVCDSKSFSRTFSLLLLFGCHCDNHMQQIRPTPCRRPLATVRYTQYAAGTIRGKCTLCMGNNRTALLAARAQQTHAVSRTS